MSSGVPSPQSHRRLVATLCFLQCLLAVAAAPIVWAETEALLGLGPPLALLGLAIAAFASSAGSPCMLLVGLIQPIATATLALLIAVLEWGPGAAETPANLFFGAGAILTPLGAVAVLIELKQSRDQPWRPLVRGLRFSMRSALLAATVLCVVFACAASLGAPGDGETFLFGGYALTMLALAIAIALRYVLALLNGLLAPPHMST